MQFEWSVSLGAIGTLVAVILGFFGHGVMQVAILARHAALFEGRLANLDDRLERLEKVEERMAEVVVKIAESRTELKLLSDRINDVQEHGSHRLAEILSDMRHRRP